MIDIGVNVTIPKGFDLTEVEKELQDGLRDVAREHRADMESFVMNWKNKPKITQDEKKKTDRYAIRVYPTGENAKYWIFVSFGTSEHSITPKRARYLRFPYQGAGQSYVPKTTPGGGFGGAGKKLGPIQRFTGVSHPGIEARHFEKEIIKANKKEFKKIMTDALKIGLDKAGRK